MVYDSSITLNFSKSNESAVAAVGHKDYNDFDDMHNLYHDYDYVIRSPEELAEMTPEDIKEYEDMLE